MGGVEHPDGTVRALRRPRARRSPSTPPTAGCGAGRSRPAPPTASVRTLEIEAVSDTGFHLGAGLYFGLDGHHHGEWRGDLHRRGRARPRLRRPGRGPTTAPDPRHRGPRRRPRRRRRGLGQLPAHHHRRRRRARPVGRRQLHVARNAGATRTTSDPRAGPPTDSPADLVDATRRATTAPIDVSAPLGMHQRITRQKIHKRVGELRDRDRPVTIAEHPVDIARTRARLGLGSPSGWDPGPVCRRRPARPTDVRVRVRVIPDFVSSRCTSHWHTSARSSMPDGRVP